MVRHGVLAAMLVAGLATPAAAQNQTVTGVVGSTMGVSPGYGAQASGTSGAVVTRVQRGDVTIITVIPRY